MVATATGAQASTTYSAVGDFSTTNGGVWSYGYNASNHLATPTLLDEYLTNIFPNVSPPGVSGWHNVGGSCCNGTGNSVLIAKNFTAGTASYETIVQPNTYLEMDPEANASADLIFTVPTTGTYTVGFNFLGIDSHGNPHGVDVLVDGVAVFAGAIPFSQSTAGSTFSGFYTAGTTIDFQTLTSTYAYLSTGVQAEITLSAVPLPASLPMFGGALLALAGFGYSMNRWVAPKAKTAA